MDPYEKPAPKNRASMAPFIALALSTVVFALIVFSLLGTVATLKQENKALEANFSSLKDQFDSKLGDIEGYRQQAVQLQAELRDYKVWVDAIPALQGDVAALKDATADPGFAVESFSLAFYSDADYQYQSYTGAGTVRTADAQGTYLVLLKKTLKSGGAPTTEPVEYMPVLVVGGSGAFTTDDSAEGTLHKPDYRFEIVGFVRLASVEKAGN